MPPAPPAAAPQLVPQQQSAMAIPAVQRQLAQTPSTNPAHGAPAMPQPMLTTCSPDNPVLETAFYQAMNQDNTSANTSLTMDDIRNVILSQGRSAVASRGRAPQPGGPGLYQQ